MLGFAAGLSAAKQALTAHLRATGLYQHHTQSFFGVLLLDSLYASRRSLSAFSSLRFWFSSAQ